MKRIEKTVFISYRRADRWPALAVFKDLTQHGYDVFIDYDGIASGHFEEAILDNIRSRAHFVVLLTPTALERCDDPADWLRREVEAAIEHRRNVVPLLLDGFDFAAPLAIQRLRGSLEPLRRYQAIRVPNETEYFDAATALLRGRYLAVPVEAVLHRPSARARQVAEEQREAAAQADQWLPGKSFRDECKDGGAGPMMIVIPAGQFLMGSPTGEPQKLTAEDPQHQVVIAHNFALGVYPVTFDEYDFWCEVTKRSKPGDRGWGRERRPVINVSWVDAQAYCDWLTEQSGRRYRLPSEAQWEYACRVGTTTPFYFGERLTTDQANFNGNYTYNGSAKGVYRGNTMAVGSFPANAFGLYDMHGNVWEWCEDSWHENYEGAPADGSAWNVSQGRSRVLRGGSWFSLPRFCRSASRDNKVLDFCVDYIGFRVCCSSPIE